MKKDPLEVSNNDDEEVDDDKILSPKSDRIFDPDSKESDNENEEQESEMDKNEGFFAKENNVLSDSEGEDEMSDEEEDHNIKVSQFCFKFFLDIQ